MKRSGPFVIPTHIEETRWLLAWVSQRLGGATFNEKTSQVIGCDDGHGNMGGAVVYSDRSGPNMYFTLCCDHPRLMTRDKVSALLGLPFNNPEIQRLTGMIVKGNKRSVKLAEGMGFKREGVLRQAAPDGSALLVYGLLRSEYDARYRTHNIDIREVA